MKKVLTILAMILTFTLGMKSQGITEEEWLQGTKGHYVIPVCSRIEQTYDRFAGDTTFGFYGINNEINITKSMLKCCGRSYYISLIVDNYKSIPGAKGMLIILTNGKKIVNLESKLQIKYESGVYRYILFYKLNKDELDLLSTESIISFKLYTFTKTIEEKDSKDFKEAVNYLQQDLKLKL